MTCFDEPELDDVMNDSVTLALMAADHVDRAALDDLFSAVKQTLPPPDRAHCDCG